MAEAAHAETGLAGRIAAFLREEIAMIAVVGAYLFVIFASVLAFTWAKMDRLAVDGTLLLFAGGKALVIAHFISMGERMRVGTVRLRWPLAVRILLRGAALLALILLFMAVEDGLHALLKGEGFGHGLDMFREQPVAELVTTHWLIFLVLLPLVAILELARETSLDAVWGRLFGPGPAAGVEGGDGG